MRCTHILELLYRLHLYCYLYHRSLPMVLRQAGAPFLSLELMTDIFDQLGVHQAIKYSPTEFEAYWEQAKVHQDKVLNSSIKSAKACVCSQIRSLPEIESDYMMMEYAKTTKKLRTVVIYPLAYNYLDKIMPIMEANGSILYQKTIEVNRKMMKNLIWLFYIRETRMGREPKQSPFWPDKIDKTMGGQAEGKLTLFVFKPKNSDEVRPMKESIREKCKYGFHSIHINSFSSEKLELCKSLLHAKTLATYNYTLTNFSGKKVKPFFALWDKYQEIAVEYQDGIIADLSYLLDDSKVFEYEVASHLSRVAELKEIIKFSRRPAIFAEKNIYNSDYYFYWFGIKCYLPRK